MAKKSVASQMGKALAYLQDTVDVAVTWGFSKLRKLQIPEEDSSKAASTFKKGLNKASNFLGELGESFYREYERIKKDRQ